MYNMKLISLQSGSNGNCFYVEAGGVQLLFDAGISGRQAAAVAITVRLRKRRREMPPLSRDGSNLAWASAVHRRWMCIEVG